MLSSVSRYESDRSSIIVANSYQIISFSVLSINLNVPNIFEKIWIIQASASDDSNSCLMLL